MGENIPKNLLNMAERHSKAAPYHLFYNRIPSLPDTNDQLQSISFRDLLDPSLGEIETSLQISFKLDIDWLLDQYAATNNADKPLTIIYGDVDLPHGTLKEKRLNVNTIVYENNHAKLSLFCYKNEGLRVVISTSNLALQDWDERTQGLWISPECPPMRKSTEGCSNTDSKTEFKKFLLNFLKAYNLRELDRFIHKVTCADFSAINVYFVGSVPGLHEGSNWGMYRIENLLIKYCSIPKSESGKWDLTATTSGVGSYGNSPMIWLHHFMRCFSTSKEYHTNMPILKVIYPTVNNYLKSNGNFSFSYTSIRHQYQEWITKHLYQWSAIQSGRNSALPHLKTYLRVSQDSKNVAYFLLTSANLSRGSWGTPKDFKYLRIIKFEAGVLFMPQDIIQKNYFSLEPEQENALIIPYDLPAVPYGPEDKMFIQDQLE